MSTGQESEYWVVCPVCHKPNPAGTKYCKHCWGAALGSQKPVSSEQLETILSQRQAYLRRRRLIVRSSIAVASAVVAALIVLPVLFNYTDVLSRPPAGLNSASGPGEWSMFRHDLSNTGATGSTVPGSTLKWTFDTGSVIHSSAAVANGTVYFGARDGKLYALDAQTGAKRWEFETGSRVESSPAVVGDSVYFGSNDGFLYSVDAQTGEELWRFKTFYPVISSPAVADGTVYFGADNYYVYAVDAVRGTKIWQFNARGPVECSPVVADGLVYVGSGTEYVYVLNAANGRPRLRYKIHNSTYGTPAIVGDTAIAANFEGEMYVFEGRARNWPLEYELKPYWLQVWAFGLAPAPPRQSGFLWGLRIGRQTSSTPVVRGDTLYIGADSNLVSVDLKERKKGWTFATGGQVRSSPALVGDTLFVGSTDGRLYAVNAATGEKVWDYMTGDQITSSPTVADGIVYIGSHDGKFYAFE